MKIFLFFLVFSLLSAAGISELQAAQGKYRDTIPSRNRFEEIQKRGMWPSDYRISREGFHQLYGFDNNSKLIIDHYFKKRKEAITYIILPVLVLLAILFFYAITLATSSILAGLILFMLIMGYNASWIMRIVGLVNLNTYKKQNLLYTLIDYYKTGYVPEKLRRALKISGNTVPRQEQQKQANPEPKKMEFDDYVKPN